MSDLKSRFVERMKRRRKVLRISQAQMAAKLDVVQAQYSNYEAGNSGIDLELAEKIAKALDTPVMVLLEPETDADRAELIEMIRDAPAEALPGLKGLLTSLLNAFPAKHHWTAKEEVQSMDPVESMLSEVPRDLNQTELGFLKAQLSTILRHRSSKKSHSTLPERLPVLQKKRAK